MKLTVSDGAGGSDSDTQVVTLPVALKSAQTASGLPTSITTTFTPGGPVGATRGNVIVNGGQTDGVVNAGPREHSYSGRRGTNTVEAIVLTPVAGEGLWTFDFSRAQYFALGSIKPTVGNIVTLSSRSVVFRLSGAAGERIAFEVELSP